LLVLKRRSVLFGFGVLFLRVRKKKERKKMRIFFRERDG
jgi:hypothetical protein